MKSKQYTFWQLLSEKKVIIPIIQRDYAQGREGKEYLRKNFLEQLGESLFDKTKPTELDFVYGTEQVGSMYPIDGQQRLTTLWLMHWYVAFKAGKTNLSLFTKEERKKIKEESQKLEGLTPQQKEIVETIKRLKNFSYETRSSSREFCENLCYLEYKETDKIVDYITNQTWFFSSWKQDPTIQSMLRMLSGTDMKNKEGDDFIDGIEELFKEKNDFKKYWDVLTNEGCPITFNFLPLQSSELPVSDDLYIKMNARGKALTDFENFKAELVRWIYKEENKTIWIDESEEKTINPVSSIDKSRANYVSLIDNQWTDIFWQNKKDDGKIDELYFAFFNRYLLNFAIEKGKITINSKLEVIEGQQIWKLYGIESNDSKIGYNGFDLYEQLPLKEFLDNLKLIFDRIKGINIQEYFPSWSIKTFAKDFYFIPRYKNDIVYTLTRSQRVLFYGICKYFEKYEFHLESFISWIRVICNLIETPEITSIYEMSGRIKLINQLSVGANNIYLYLTNNDDLNTSNAQLIEEIAKAKQILSDDKAELRMYKDKNTWEDKIKEAESALFFNGAIRFLFTDAKGNMNDWGNFRTKFENAKEYFDVNGVKSSYKSDAFLLRRLLSYFDKWELWWQIVFGHSSTAWRSILLNSKLYSQIHQLLCLNDSRSYDFSTYVSPFIHENESQIKFLSEMLIRELVLSCLTNDLRLVWRGSWDVNGVYDLDPGNKGSHPYFVIHPRLQLLDGKELEIVNCKRDINCPLFIYGEPDIKFKYNERLYEWYITRRKAEEYNVYLLDRTTKTYANKKKLGISPDDKDYYYGIYIGANDTKNSFKNKLIELAQRYDEDNL